MRYFLLGFLILLIDTARCQSTETLLNPGRIIFYNTENLFDTINDPATNDDEFLPAGKMQWNTERYKTKLEHLAKVLGALCDSVEPIAIGLAEVENENVLQDLIAQPPLNKFNLGIVHHDSPDERGIDVAILYNRNRLEASFDAVLQVPLKDDKTRDIVYLKGFMDEAYPVWIFVNHWSSRHNGKPASDPKRAVEAKVLKDKIDNLYLGEPFSRVIVMGDFNDNPNDSSVVALTKGKPAYPEQQQLVNLMTDLQKQGKCTIKYKNGCDLFDQFLVSSNLQGSNNLYYVRKPGAQIFAPDWLLFKHPQYGAIPNRTYAGTLYTGGYSDHLPVYFDLIFK